MNSTLYPKQKQTHLLQKALSSQDLLLNVQKGDWSAVFLCFNTLSRFSCTCCSSQFPSLIQYHTSLSLSKLPHVCLQESKNARIIPPAMSTEVLASLLRSSSLLQSSCDDSCPHQPSLPTNCSLTSPCLQNLLYFSPLNKSQLCFCIYLWN